MRLSTGIQSAVDDPPTQIMLLALLPFAVYLVANQFGSSGILAAVSAGVTPKNSKKCNQYLASG